MLPHAVFSLIMSLWVRPGGQGRSNHRHPRGDSLSQALSGRTCQGTPTREPVWPLGSSELVSTAGQRTVKAALGGMFKAVVDIGAAGLGCRARVARAGGHAGLGGLFHLLLLQHQSCIDIRPCRGTVTEDHGQGGHVLLEQGSLP